jgi:DNA-binding transcriptional regulator YhcF (GntR family)
MGRRTKWENEERPVEEKIIEIVASSDARGVRFTEIVALAEKESISRATVARTLSMLKKKGLVKQNGAYRLAMEAVQWKHAQRSLFSVLSMYIFNDVIDAIGQKKFNDEEFTRVFTSKIGALAMYVLLIGISEAAKNNPKSAGKWIEEAFGTLPQKYGWRVCLNRQIFGGPVILKQPIMLKKLPVPEIVVDNDVIYSKSPSTADKGLAAEVFRELSPIPAERLASLKESLKKLFPSEVEVLDEALFQIKKAANVSQKGR